MPLSQTGAELLFEVFSQRYERGSTVVTSNLPFDEWTSVFGSERLTGALLDRLTHHVHILQMNGDSYRLNQSKRRLTPFQLGHAGGSSQPSLMPDEKAPSSGPSCQLIDVFLLRRPMHFCSGVDNRAIAGPGVKFVKPRGSYVRRFRGHDSVTAPPCAGAGGDVSERVCLKGYSYLRSLSRTRSTRCGAANDAVINNCGHAQVTD